MSQSISNINYQMTRLINSTTFSLFYYQARLIWHINLWIAPLIALLIPLFLFLPEGAEEEKIFWALRICESFAPFLGIIICANLFSQEWEMQVAELWLTKAISRAKLFLSRLSIATGYTIIVLCLLFAELYLTYVHFDWKEMFLVVLPPTLFLGFLGLLIGLLFRSSAIAFLIPLIYWAFEITTKGKYTGPFFLFARTTFTCADSPDVCTGLSAGQPWAITKWLLLLLSFVLVLSCIWVLHNINVFPDLRFRLKKR